MIEPIVEIELPVGEKLVVKKNRIGERKGVTPIARLSVVTGIHGEELEGQYVCYELVRRLNENPEFLRGVVEVYPALNPLGVDMATREMPNREVDLNRSFPGDKEGDMLDRITAAIVDSLKESDLIIDVHSSDIFLRELPQVRISNQFADKLLPFAKQMNTDLVWLTQKDVAHDATLAHTMNTMGIPTLVLEMGSGLSLNRAYGDQIVDGIFNLMVQMGMWLGPINRVKAPVVSSHGEVEFIRSDLKGIFIPNIEHNHYVEKNELLGALVSPYTGNILAEIRAKKPGLVFSLRMNPMVYEGALIARILSLKEEG